MADPRVGRTVAEVEALALAEYERWLGKVVHVTSVDGYLNDDFTTVNGPRSGHAVRVSRTPRQSICRWMDDVWMDPVWDIEPIDGATDILGLHAGFAYGTCYATDGRTERGDIIELYSSEATQPA